MNLVQLYIQRDAAHDTFDELGELGRVQFHDLNPNVNAFQRNFVNEVKRCDDMERRLRFLKAEMEKENKTLGRGETLLSVSGIAPPDELPKDDHNRPIFDFDELEATLEQTERELREANDNYDDLKSNFLELLETMHVLEKDSTFFDANGQGEEEASISMAEDADAVPSAHNTMTTTTTTTRASRMTTGALKVGYVSGVVLSSKANLFERVLWRALHGNLYFKVARIDDEEIVDPATGDVVEKSVFVVFFHGQQSQIKIRKICDAFSARVVEVPNSRGQRGTMLTDVQSRLRDLRTIISHGQEQRRQVLARVSVRFDDWSAFVRREKAIYNVMNMCNFDAGRKSLIAEGWVPVMFTDAVSEALNHASRRNGTQASIMSIVRTKETPPTFFKTDEFTEVFDAVVESYGVATYGEVSPASLSVITFPFLFAIMFGDAGHAIMLLIVSVAMCMIYPKIKGKPMNEIVDLLMSGRYLLVLMAVFSIYTGMIYNDFFSISFPLFDSPYKGPDHERCEYGKSCTKESRDDTYPFGLDPIWRRSDNELFLSNSLKMKLSIVFGVVQMEAGIVLSLFNHLHFKRTLDVFFEFIPQVTFMTCTFGYLVFLVFFKWLSDSITPATPYLINVFINMFIDFGHLDYQMYSGQNGVQMTLAILTIISALAMLIPKPIIELVLHKRKKAKPVQPTGPMFSHNDDDGVRVPLMMESDNSAVATTSTTPSNGAIVSSSDPTMATSTTTESDEGEEAFSFADAFINNAIHSIEFILGCVSNTASYLRLWALSLAHAQLSSVFYEQLFLRGILWKNFFMMFIFWGGWGGITIAILLGMEALSAFLHCLRLHWVEFMNKFYVAEGYAFEAFSFEKILAAPSDDSSA